MACEAWACQAIVNAVNEEWISDKHKEYIGYQAIEPLELLKLLCNAGGDLDDLEITDSNTKMLEPWDRVEAPVTMFARADKYMSVSWKGIPIQSNPTCASCTRYQLTRPVVSSTLQCENGMPSYLPTRPSPISVCTIIMNTPSKSNETGQQPEPSERAS